MHLQVCTCERKFLKVKREWTIKMLKIQKSRKKLLMLIAVCVCYKKGIITMIC